MNCPKAQDLMLQQLDGVLEPAQRERLDEHLGSCEHCAEAWAALQRLAEDLPELEAEPPPEFAARIKRAVWEETGRRRARRALGWAAAAAAAASLLVGCLLGKYALARHEVQVRTAIREVRVPVEKRVEVPVREIVRVPVKHVVRVPARTARAEPAATVALAERAPEEQIAAVRTPVSSERPAPRRTGVAPVDLSLGARYVAERPESSLKPEDVSALAEELATALEAFEEQAAELGLAPGAGEMTGEPGETTVEEPAPTEAAEPAGRLQP